MDWGEHVCGLVDRLGGIRASDWRSGEWPSFPVGTGPNPVASEKMNIDSSS